MTEQNSPKKFTEKILYKTHQHAIILIGRALQMVIVVAFPVGVIVYFVSGYVLWITLIAFVSIGLLAIGYQYFLYCHSWLLIGNQKITLAVRASLWSQYAINVRYRNIRDSAVCKNSFWGYFLGFGTIFVRSSANEGDFHAYYVPKVGKVFAIVSTLSRYTDDERSRINTIEALYEYHQNAEFRESDILQGKTPQEKTSEAISLEANISRVKNITGVTAVTYLDQRARTWISEHEETRNHGVFEVLRRKHVIAFTHNSSFRAAAGEIATETLSGEVYFPGVPFPEVIGRNVISGSPGIDIHTQIFRLFPHVDAQDATVIVGWDE